MSNRSAHSCSTLAVICLAVCLLNAALPARAECSPRVFAHQKISDTEGNFDGVLDDMDVFGSAVALLEDLDGDGVDDLAVGAALDDDGGTDRGAVWILFLNDDGTVRSHQKISSTEGGFTGILDDDDRFGAALAALQDLDGDGISELAVGAYGDEGGGTNRGAVWILFLDDDGTVRSHQKISDIEGGFIGPLNNGDAFGNSVAALDDLDGDGVGELVVGTPNDSVNGFHRGALWVLFLDVDTGGVDPVVTVKSHQKINEVEGGFVGPLHNSDLFGWSVISLQDLDRDGVPDLATGAFGDDDGSPQMQTGAVWILFLDVDLAGATPVLTVKAEQKISATAGLFDGVLDQDDLFGYSLALADLDGDGAGELAVGAKRDDDGIDDAGAVWVLSLDTDGTVTSNQKISNVEGHFPTGGLSRNDQFGASVASLGDFNDDGVDDLAVGALLDDDGGVGCGISCNHGAVWLLLFYPPLILEIDKDEAGAELLSWGPPGDALAYDVLRGDLFTLHDPDYPGDFSRATEECVAFFHFPTTLADDVDPSIGQGFWFLVRRRTADGNESWDSCGLGQAGPRDPGIVASGAACP